MPLANYALLTACTAAFAWELMSGPLLDQRIDSFGLVPARFHALAERAGVATVYAPFFTSTFLHAGFLHYGLNMLFLWIFGGPVEDRLGHVRYLGFYLGGALAAGLAHVSANPASVVPTIGASGAIAAVMGAYFVLYPRAWVTSFLPPLFWLQVPVPALLYLAFWFGMQLYMGSAEAALAGESARVAWWAHSGGFAFGTLVILLFVSRRPPEPDEADR